jgi:hypothetical protein
MIVHQFGETAPKEMRPGVTIDAPRAGVRIISNPRRKKAFNTQSEEKADDQTGI